MRRFPVLALLTAILGMTLASPAAAVDPFKRPTMVKKSFRHMEWGYGFGIGASLMATTAPRFVVDEEDEITDLTWGDELRERKLATSAAFSLGYGVGKNWMLGGEGRFWMNTFDGEEGREKWHFIQGALTLRWHPLSLGLFLSGGLGFAYTGNSFTDIVGTDKNSNGYSGWSGQAAAGWEWRLPAQDNVLTLRPEFSYQYLELGDGPKTDAFAFILHLHMYTNNRKLDQYFRGDR